MVWQGWLRSLAVEWWEHLRSRVYRRGSISLLQRLSPQRRLNRRSHPGLRLHQTLLPLRLLRLNRLPRRLQAVLRLVALLQSFAAIPLKRTQRPGHLMEGEWPPGVSVSMYGYGIRILASNCWLTMGRPRRCIACPGRPIALVSPLLPMMEQCVSGRRRDTDHIKKVDS